MDKGIRERMNILLLGMAAGGIAVGAGVASNQPILVGIFFSLVIIGIGLLYWLDIENIT